ncbi:hypothetical protein AB0H76_32365 [Nocardia sp. NPDC050712]|uniref:hypothetical protein n=1 Tax=Nocardia sp. NPDC050712 TaxID=3155518 RepID=UPI003400F0F9
MAAVPSDRWAALRQTLIALLLFLLWRAGRLCHAPPAPLPDPPARVPRAGGPRPWLHRLHAPHADLDESGPAAPTRTCRQLPR